MPQKVSFPNVEPSYVFERDCLSFPALADGRSIECLVTVELLMDRFGAWDPSEEAMRQAYREHKSELQAIARDHIEKGWIDKDNRLFLTTRFTKLKVTFHEAFEKWTQGRVLAEQAHAILVQIISPRAGELTVEWGRTEEVEGGPLITLRIVDPAFQQSSGAAFRPDEWQDLASLRLRLSVPWNSVLQGRSRKLVLKLG